MGKLQKKGEAGIAAEHVSRSQALKRLQLSPLDFRRLCILKGIYPRNPKHKSRIGNKATNKKTIYLLKDIRFLSHEPLLAKFRELKSFQRHLHRYLGKRDWSKVQSLKKNCQPQISLDHLVRERYPSFADALQDLDDPLSMLALFARLPRTDVSAHRANISRTCSRLLREFEAYVVATGSLKKAFISIKGIYYQAEILGQSITWVVPHEVAMPAPSKVDYEVMLTFLEFYMVLLRFVNYRLFARLGWTYPEQEEEEEEEEGENEEKREKRQKEREQDKHEYSVLLRSQFPPIDKPEELFPEGDKRMLEGAKIFISREVPNQMLAFVLQSLGAQISWASIDDSAPFTEDDPSITHQIVDRPMLNRMFVGRQYLQPQWAFDSLNLGTLADTELYRIGVTLPPHLSPFVTKEQDNDDEAEEEEEEEEAEEAEEDTEETAIQEQGQEMQQSKKTGKAIRSAKKQKLAEKEEKKAQKELAVSMMSKKRQKLYESMQQVRQKRIEEKRKLTMKRKQLNKKAAQKE